MLICTAHKEYFEGRNIQAYKGRKVSRETLHKGILNIKNNYTL